jgi:hypothetical protein
MISKICKVEPRTMKNHLPTLVMAVAGIITTACTDDDTQPGEPTATSGASGGQGGGGATGAGGGLQENVYMFESRFVPGESAVAYDGQAYRQALIEAMKSDIGGLTTLLDNDSYNPASAQAVFDRLEFYYAHDGSTAVDVPVGITTTPAAAQTAFGDYAGDASLDNKLAGKDTVTDHRDWSTEFSGWTDTSIAAFGGAIDSPEGLLQAFMWSLAEQVYQRSLDVIPTEPGTVIPLSEAFVTPTGLDLRQLIQKFLSVAVTYAQASDDYLERDSTQPEKGLLASNAQSEDGPYSELGHHWDEGFGYWGGARDYVLYDDGEIAATSDGRADWQGYHDSNDDGAIDLATEYN